MSLYGNKNILFQLQGTLLSACHERKNQRSHEVFGTKDDIYTSDHCDKAFGRNEKRKDWRKKHDNKEKTALVSMEKDVEDEVVKKTIENAGYEVVEIR